MLLVIGYHFAPDVLPAGFLGVDVFFVLSGFLITRLLLAEAEGTGGLRLGRFWGRRARRLLPALLLTVLGTCLVALLTDLDGGFDNLAAHARASLLYVVNWAFIAEKSSYFAAFEAPSPLRHMWSLAIEEQFYLVWPLVLLGIYKTLKNRRPLIAVGVVAAVGAVLSAVLMAVLFEPGADPSRVYYGTDTRVFGVLVGAVAAVIVVAAGAEAVRRRARWLPVAGALALAAVLAVAIRSSDRSDLLYQGGLLALSAAVAVLVLAVTVVPAGGAARVLSFGLLRQVGVISYGLYLYHWPVFVYVSERTTGRTGLSLFLLRCAITLALAVVSFFAVERPIREGRFPARTRTASTSRLWMPVAGGVAVVAIFVLTMALPTPTSIPTTLPAPTTAQAPPPAGAADPQATGSTPSASAPLAAPTPGAPAAGDDLRILVAGDSVGFTFAYYWPLAATKGVAIDGTAALGCRLQPGVVLQDGEEIFPTNGCPDWRTAWPAKLAEFRPDVVVLFATEWEVFDARVDDEDIDFGTPESDAEVQRYLDDLRTMVSAAGSRLVLVASPPITAPDQPEGNPRHRGEEWRVEHLNELYRAFAAAHPDSVAILAMDELVCSDEPCGSEPDGAIDGQAVFEDGLHFDRDGMAVLAPRVLPELRALAGG